MEYFRTTPKVLARANSQKGHMSAGHPRGNAD